MVAPGQKTNVPSKYYSHVKKNNHGVIFLRSRDWIRILLNKLFLPLSPMIMGQKIALHELSEV